MSEWKSPVQPVRCKVDLTAPLTVRRERGVLVQGDKNANAIVAEVYQANGVPYDLTGSTVTLTFVRPDKLAVSPIKAEINGNVAVMTLTEACYRYSGMYGADVTLKNGEMDRTVVRILGDIISTQNDGTVDDEKLFPTPEELLETLEKVEAARQNAETAANRANTAAARAEQLQIDASGLAGDSNKLGGKPPEYYLPAVQLLDNPDFAIAQAGYGGFHGNTRYAADCWKMSNVNTTITKNADGSIAVTTAENDGFTDVSQTTIQSAFAGKPMTAAVNIDGQIAVVTFVFGNNAETINEKCTLIIYPESTECSTLIIRCYSKTPINIYWAALCPGTYTAETLPPFVPPDPVVELAKCQRYYEELIYPLNIMLPAVMNRSELNSCKFNVPYTAAKRISNPTVSIEDYGPSGMRFVSSLGGIRSITSVTALSTNSTSAGCMATFEPALTSESSGWVDGFKVTISADL